MSRIAVWFFGGAEKVQTAPSLERLPAVFLHGDKRPRIGVRPPPQTGWGKLMLQLIGLIETEEYLEEGARNDLRRGSG